MVDAESVSARIERLGSLLEDYRGVFESFRKAGLDDSLASRLGDAAGMRNILAHDYLEVDDEEVWNAIGRLDDLREFAAFAQRRCD